MTQHRAFRPIALVTLSLLVMSAAACGHSSPAAPDPVAVTNTAAASTTAIVPAVEPSTTATFPLSEGKFTITDRKGAQLSGTYRGETSETAYSSVTTLTLEVTGGTGGLKGAKGTLEGHGLGAFTGEGAFSVDISGTIATGGREEEREVHRSAQRRVEHLLQRRSCPHPADRQWLGRHEDGPRGRGHAARSGQRRLRLGG